MISGIQIIGAVFGISMAYLTFLYYKRNEFGKIQMFFWEILWIGFIFLTLFPQTANIAMERLGVSRAMDLFIILGFIFVAVLTFHNYVKVNKLEKKLENAVRKESLQNLTNEK